MKALLLVGLALVAAASALVEVQKGYHEEIGIPTAERIRKQELALAEGGPGKIVGGSIAPLNAHPYFAGLLISLNGMSGNSVCGSSILSANRVVTAAHCWRDRTMQAWQFLVIYGSNNLFFGGTRIATSNVIVHPQYNNNNYNNDVAMVLMPTSVLFSASIQPVSLPTGNEVFDSFAGQWAIAAGFGKTNDQQSTASQTVSHVNLQVITTWSCQMVFGNWYVVPSTLCTAGSGGVGICGGDSGGPLVWNRNGSPVLIGISSFVATAGCQLGFPSAFARVTSFLSFIQPYL